MRVPYSGQTMRRRVTHPFKRARKLAAEARHKGVKGASARDYRSAMLAEHRGR